MRTLISEPAPLADDRPSRRVVLATFGSPGDLNPYLAIALELRRRGHDPVVATSACYRPRVEALGVRFHPVRPDQDLDSPDPDFVDRLRKHWRSPASVFQEMFWPALEESYIDTLAAVEGADLLVSHSLAFTAPLVAERTGVAWASAVLQPLGFFSGYDPPVLGATPAPLVERARRIGPAATRPAMIAAKAVVRPWNRPWHRLRARIGLPPTRVDPIFNGQHSPALVLALFSRVFGERQPDWPTPVVVTGFPLFDDPAQPLPPALADFLADGPPPIVFTLGTTAVRDAGDFYRASAAAAEAAGLRAVLVGAVDAPLRSSWLPAGAMSVAYAPYAALFPRAAATVHQGGIGTLALAMRAGKPMAIMPYGHDQPDNAARARRLGIARVIPRRAYTVDRVAATLQCLLSDPLYGERAAAVGRTLRAEDGAGAAADAIEALLAAPTSRYARLNATAAVRIEPTRRGR
ncbi:MAG TPA: glycosyltransferase [Thermomicrobiales bacterium]|nr:glycosyltransferase [Thermomicrobiales bacterium]